MLEKENDLEIGAQQIEPNAAQPEVKLEIAETETIKPVIKKDDIPNIPLWDKLFPKVHRKNFLRNFFLTALALTTLLAIALFFVFHIDGIFVPSTLTGSVLDHKNQPLAGVKVLLAGQQAAQTDATGKFTLVKAYGNYKLTLRLDKFADLNLDVDIKRGNNEIKVNMTPNGIGDVKIKFTAQTGTINTDNLDIEFDGKAYVLNANSEIALDSYPVGKYKLSVTSPIYYDIYDEMEVKAIANAAEVQLAPAWDTQIQFVDWLTGQPLDQIKANLDGVKFEADKSGQLQITDLTKIDNIKLAASREHYLTKDTLIQKSPRNAQNQIIIPMVREGKTLYISNRTGNKNVYIASYDGTDELRLSDDRGDNYAAEIVNNQVRFLSTRDKIKNEYGSLIALPYSVGWDAKGLTKLAKTNYNDYGHIGFYNFKAGKRLFALSNPNLQDSYTSSLFFGNIDGSGSSLLTEQQDNLYSFLIADDSSFIIFSKGSSGGDSILYLNTKTKAVTTIYTGAATAELYQISPDNKSVLVDIYDGVQDRNDLWNISLNGKAANRLTNSSVNENEAQFLNNNTVVYVSERDNKKDLFILDTAKKTENKLTIDGAVDNFTINSDGLITYFSDKTLWIIDPINPAKAQKITSNVVNDYLNTDEY